MPIIRHARPDIARRSAGWSGKAAAAALLIACALTPSPSRAAERNDKLPLEAMQNY